MKDHASLLVKLLCRVQIQHRLGNQLAHPILRDVLQISVNPRVRYRKKYCAIAPHKNIFRARRQQSSRFSSGTRVRCLLSGGLRLPLIRAIAGVCRF